MCLSGAMVDFYRPEVEARFQAIWLVVWNQNEQDDGRIHQQLW